MVGLVLLGLLCAPWLAAGWTPAPPPASLPPRVRVVALGDVTFGRYVGRTVVEQGGDFGYPLVGVAPLLHAADLGLANLEGVLQADPPALPPSGTDLEQLPLIGDLRAAPALAAAGVNVIGLANNHVLDAGPEALAATRAALTQAGVMPVGAGGGPAAARVAQVRTVQGLRVAILARSAVRTNHNADAIGAPGVMQPAVLDPAQPADLDTLRADLTAARAEADVVILLMHWGVEYTTAVQESQRRIAAVAAAAGVDLVVGAHSHVAGPVEVLGARPTVVAWSLGNAVFDQQWRPDLREGLALDAQFDARGLVALQMRPLWRQGVQPAPVPPADAHSRAVLGRIWAASAAKLQTHVLHYTNGSDAAYALLPALAYRRADPPPPVQTLRADLDRDGTPEAITLQAGQLAVAPTAAGAPRPRLPWRSPAGWRVDAFAVAAPPDAPDLAFTVWKPTERTEIRATELRDAIRQHFFLFGWRRGAIRPVWNSSALPRPFLAFALAPGGPAGAARLVGLEGDYFAAARPPALTVWAWNGFGYSLEWRSADQPGATTLWRDGDQVIMQ
jgi:poly-gamma-glutamate synthesis protein (capsule biosynthesis protein)